VLALSFRKDDVASEVRHLQIAAGESGWRFDRWARAHFPDLPYGRLMKLLRTGQFRLDGRRVDASTRVEAGQTVRVPPLGEAERPESPPGRRPLSERDARLIRSLVVHQDQDLIVLAKPAGLAVQGGSGTHRHIDGMLDALAEGGERPRLVHRLDRDTAGLLVLARHARAAKALMHAFQQHRVRKLYWAIVLGRPPQQEGIIDLRLGKAGPPGRERMTPDAPEAKRARTGFRVLARAGKVGAWLALVPYTGRTHQLRAHCVAIGCPIMGDYKYGPEVQLRGAPEGLMLQAIELELPHPSGGVLSVRAEPAAHVRAGLAFLGLAPEPLPGSRLADWQFEQ
jgi:23S rRNA pseudouridine955/2504/2580 synthase